MLQRMLVLWTIAGASAGAGYGYRTADRLGSGESAVERRGELIDGLLGILVGACCVQVAVAGSARNGPQRLVHTERTAARMRLIVVIEMRLQATPIEAIERNEGYVRIAKGAFATACCGRGSGVVVGVDKAVYARTFDIWQLQKTVLENARARTSYVEIKKSKK